MAAIKALSDSTAERVDLPTGFLRIAIADLENNPFSFPIMRQPWNRIIDELGLPTSTVSVIRVSSSIFVGRWCMNRCKRAR